MHSWVWGETYPDFMDALMPLASAPVEIVGRNRVWRKMIMDAIRNDPDWNNGEYQEQPRGLQTAYDIMILMGSAPLYMHQQAPKRDEADKLLATQMQRYARRKVDANDLLYNFDASREYNPSPMLENIKAPLCAVNSADDQINPPELAVVEREIKRVPKGKFVLLPISDETRGHGTHTYANVWKKYLAELLDESKPQSQK
jgi:homoserine O-acetyltransferase/O-succinyltransferase